MKTNKIFTVLIISILAVSAILMVYPSGVLAANPSVPEFTVQYVDHSYDVPVTHWTTTDPYTGTQVTHSSGGEHVDNRTIDVTITNQPFTTYKDSTSNQTINLYYNIRSKGHFENWNGNSDLGSHSQTGLQASTSTITVVSFSLQYWNVPQGGQIDFQVKAITGFTYYNSQSCGTQYQTTVGDSGWSNTETITIGSPSTPSPTTPPYVTPNPTFNPQYPTATPWAPQYPTATPTQPNTLTGVFGSDWEQTALIVMAVIIAVFVVVVAVLLRKVAHK
ncbi:MAG: hypothetical protein M1490_00010 [Candidatus Bathyarchaeota archaeon]|nr:hypothetical protein [Candidatus Bathyarchaeota archaeon]